MNSRKDKTKLVIAIGDDFSMSTRIGEEEGRNLKHQALEAVNKSLEGNRDLEKKKLMLVSCPICDEDIMIYSNADLLHCKKCNTNIQIDFNSLVLARYTCPYCNNNGFFRVSTHKDLITCKCNGCEGVIDLKYHTKYARFLSLNLFK